MVKKAQYKVMLDTGAGNYLIDLDRGYGSLVLGKQCCDYMQRLNNTRPDMQYYAFVLLDRWNGDKCVYEGEVCKK